MSTQHYDPSIVSDNDHEHDRALSSPSLVPRRLRRTFSLSVMAMTGLPWEIWFLIVLLIPIHARGALRAVNTALNNVVQYVQYGSLVVTGCSPATYRLLANAACVFHPFPLHFPP